MMNSHRDAVGTSTGSLPKLEECNTPPLELMVVVVVVVVVLGPEVSLLLSSFESFSLSPLSFVEVVKF